MGRTSSNWEGAVNIARKRLSLKLAHLREVAAQLDYSRLGAPKERAAHRAEVMQELSGARQRATRNKTEKRLA